MARRVLDRGPDGRSCHRRDDDYFRTTWRPAGGSASISACVRTRSMSLAPSCGSTSCGSPAPADGSRISRGDRRPSRRLATLKVDTWSCRRMRSSQKDQLELSDLAELQQTPYRMLDFEGEAALGEAGPPATTPFRSSRWGSPIACAGTTATRGTALSGCRSNGEQHLGGVRDAWLSPAPQSPAVRRVAGQVHELGCARRECLVVDLLDGLPAAVARRVVAHPVASRWL